MVEYTCHKCNKVFNHKGNFRKHIYKKISCNPELNENESAESWNEIESAQNPHKIIIKNEQQLQKPAKPTEFKCVHCNKIFKTKSNMLRHIKKSCKIAGKKRTEFNCDHCNKKFSRQDTLYRHTIMYCKDSPYYEGKNACNKKKNTEVVLQDRIKKLEEDNKKFKDIIEKLYVNNGNSSSSVSDSIVTNGDHNTSVENKNNTINNTVNNNSNNNTINLIAFGKEDLSYITDEVSIKLLKKGFKSIPVTAEYIHGNPKTPQFQNAYIPSLSRSHAIVYSGKRWKARNGQEVIDSLYMNMFNYLEDKFEEHSESLDDYSRRRFERFLEQAKGDDSKSVTDSIKYDIKMLLYNNKDLITSHDKPNKLIK